jgi:hypothetical protein
MKPASLTEGRPRPVELRAKALLMALDGGATPQAAFDLAPPLIRELLAERAEMLTLLRCAQKQLPDWTNEYFAITAFLSTRSTASDGGGR